MELQGAWRFGHGDQAGYIAKQNKTCPQRLKFDRDSSVLNPYLPPERLFRWLKALLD